MAEASPKTASPSQAVGRALTFVLLPSGTSIPLGPAWSAFCGALAADLTGLWQAETMLRLALVILIAEVLWSTWRALLVDMNWKEYISDHPLPLQGSSGYAPPYTAPGSPLGELLNGWRRFVRWTRETLPIERRGTLLTLPVLPPLILLLSLLAGPELALLSLSALALSSLEWRLTQRGIKSYALRSVLEIGLSWLAGHIAFAPLTSSSFILACCYSLAYQGAIGLSQDLRAWSLALLFAGQAAALFIVVQQRHPFTTPAASIISLLLVPQLLLLSHFCGHQRHVQYLRRSLPFLMVAMPVAAWMV